MEELRMEANGHLGPIDSSRIPRYAGAATFARLPRLDQVGTADVAVVGVPFDSGVSYRPGARFGANHVREAVAAAAPVQPGLGRSARSTTSRWRTPATWPSTRSTSTRPSRPSSRTPLDLTAYRHASW